MANPFIWASHTTPGPIYRAPGIQSYQIFWQPLTQILIRRAKTPPRNSELEGRTPQNMSCPLMVWIHTPKSHVVNTFHYNNIVNWITLFRIGSGLFSELVSPVFCCMRYYKFMDWLTKPDLWWACVPAGDATQLLFHEGYSSCVWKQIKQALTHH